MQLNRLHWTALVAAAALTACKGAPRIDDPNPATSTRLVKFTDCGELRDWVTDAWTETLVQARYGNGWYWDEDDSNTDAGGEGPTDWSQTNVQEAGVDEPDLLKSDGEYIYIAQRGELTVVDSWPPASSEKIASLPIEGSPFALFLRGDRAAVFGHDYQPAYDESGSWRYDYATRVTVVDLSDRTAPTVLRSIELEGWYIDARMIEDDIYMVMTTPSYIPAELWQTLWTGESDLPEPEWEASEERQARIRERARAALRPRVEQAVDDLPIHALLPTYRDRTEQEDGPPRPLLQCDDVYHPRGLSTPSVLSVVHLTLDEGQGGSELYATGLMAEGWEVYASVDNLYIAQSSRWWWWGWNDIDLQTHIHQFHLDGADTRYLASGAVDGWILNQFAMSEHEEHLRVATTDVDWWWGATDEEEQGANNVFVLSRSGDTLEQVGAVRGIAPGEQIYAARFLGDRGFLVTFVQIDPLFTLDLSDPTAPRVVGELEVPGYSSYLHPVGEDYLLAVGMDATQTGQVLGFAVSLFDVSDFANPRLADRLLAHSNDWSWSEALWDHHAFTFHRGVLSVPLYTHSGGHGFSGLLVVDVDTTTGLTELGRVDHADLVADSQCLHTWYGRLDECQETYWYAWMRRSVVIEDNLYSISDYGLKVNELTAPDNEIARVLFWPQQ